MNDEAIRCIIYTCDVSPLEDEELFGFLEDKANKLRKDKIKRFRSEKDKRLSLGAEYLLMKACADFGLAYDDMAIIHEKNKKPYLVDSEHCFNLSHSGDMAICIFSDREVGCDVESRRKIDLKIAERCFSENEYRQIMESDDREDAFLRIWTLKESFSKCLGLGLGMPLDEIDFDLSEKGHFIVKDGKRYELHEYAKDGYHYAWCIQNDECEDIEYAYRIIDLEEMKKPQ